jgi:hypothetical protein
VTPASAPSRNATTTPFTASPPPSRGGTAGGQEA